MYICIHIFLASALAGGEWSALLSGPFTLGEGVPGTNWVGGCVRPRAGLDDVEHKILDSTWTRTDSSVVQPVASRYTDYDISGS
jgi:hypothetical protein